MYPTNKHKTTTWAALLLSSMLFLNMNTAAHAAAATDSLPKPAWTSSSLMLTEANTEKDVMIHNIYAVPSKNLVYVHSSQPVIKTSSKTTLDWQLDSLQALDAKTGQVKWSTIFHEKTGLIRPTPTPGIQTMVQPMCTWSIRIKAKTLLLQHFG